MTVRRLKHLCVYYSSLLSLDHHLIELAFLNIIYYLLKVGWWITIWWWEYGLGEILGDMVASISKYCLKGIVTLCRLRSQKFGGQQSEPVKWDAALELSLS